MKKDFDLSNAIFVGVDLHCDQITVCFLKKDKADINAVYYLKKNGLEKFKKEVNKDCHLLVEASTSTFAFTKAIEEHVGSVTILDARKLQLIYKDKKKTDRVDAKKIASFLYMQMATGQDLLKAVYMPDESIQELRSLFATYKLIQKNLVQIKNRIHALTRQSLLSYRKQDIFAQKNRKEILALNIPIFHSQIKMLYQFADDIEVRLENIKSEILLKGEKHLPAIELLASIKGISVFMALALISDIADIQRFKNEKHLCSYLRSTPSVDSSNATTRIGKTSKLGRKLSMTLLTQSVTHFKNGNPNLLDWSDKHSTKGKGKVRMALCRKMISIIYHMMKNGEMYRHMDANNHREKMTEYLKFLGKMKAVA